MTEMFSPVLSVRGEASRDVTPDSATIYATISVAEDTKAEALRQVAADSARLAGELAGLGGVALTVESVRLPLTWSAQAATSHDEYASNTVTGEHGPTGRTQSNLALVVFVRDFALLDPLGIVLAGYESLNVDSVNWHVDPDNPAWPQVRADAIQAAIIKGRDYATALGGELHSVEHVADDGLLGGEGEPRRMGRRVSLASFSGGADVPSLDPVPQTLQAVIEARFVATGVSLTGRG